MMVRAAMIILMSFLLIASDVSAKHLDLGTLGRTYPVVEKDSLEEIRERAAAIDWEKVLREKAIESIKSYKPEGIPFLPRAIKDRRYLVDMTYTLEFDIPNAEGGVLYPKGFTFNPLDYADFSGIWVVIDGEDSKQVAWFKTSPYARDLQAQLLITDGRYHELAKELQRPVFYAFAHIIKRLQLQEVPSIVSQRGNMMEVKTIDVTKISH